MTDVTGAISELKQRAVQIAVAIEALEGLSNGTRPRKTRVISASARAKMRAAQIRRWKKVRASKAAKRG